MSQSGVARFFVGIRNGSTMAALARSCARGRRSPIRRAPRPHRPSVDPEVLYSYASIPRRNIWSRKNVRFFLLNVISTIKPGLRTLSFASANLTGERPLILGEFGMDTTVIRSGRAGRDARMAHRKVWPNADWRNDFVSWDRRMVYRRNEFTTLGVRHRGRGAAAEGNRIPIREKFGQDNSTLPASRAWTESPMVR